MTEAINSCTDDLMHFLFPGKTVCQCGRLHVRSPSRPGTVSPAGEPTREPDAWEPLNTAPRSAKWIHAKVRNDEMLLHYADTDGDGAFPPAKGWFYWNGYSYIGVKESDVEGWKPLYRSVPSAGSAIEGEPLAEVDCPHCGAELHVERVDAESERAILVSPPPSSAPAVTAEDRAWLEGMAAEREEWAANSGTREAKVRYGQHAEILRRILSALQSRQEPTT